MLAALVYVNLLTNVASGNFFEFGIYEYYFGSEKVPYLKAETECLKKNTTLAIIDTKEINDSIKNLFEEATVRRGSYWIGLRRISESNVNSSFKWIDGTPLNQTFSNWDKNEFKNIESDCVVLAKKKNIFWKVVNCTEAGFPLCQRKVRACNKSINPCRSNSHCDDSIGYIQCICNSGYQGDGLTNCTDIDECETMSNPSEDTYCINTPGSFYCEQEQIKSCLVILIASVGGLIGFAAIMLITTCLLHKKWKTKAAINEEHANFHYTSDSKKKQTKENNSQLAGEQIDNREEYENVCTGVGNIAEEENVYNNVGEQRRPANSLNTIKDTTYDTLR